MQFPWRLKNRLLPLQIVTPCVTRFIRRYVVTQSVRHSGRVTVTGFLDFDPVDLLLLPLHPPGGLIPRSRRLKFFAFTLLGGIRRSILLPLAAFVSSNNLKCIHVRETGNRLSQQSPPVGNFEIRLR